MDNMKGLLGRRGSKPGVSPTGNQEATSSSANPGNIEPNSSIPRGSPPKYSMIAGDHSHAGQNNAGQSDVDHSNAGPSNAGSSDGEHSNHRNAGHNNVDHSNAGAGSSNAGSSNAGSSNAGPSNAGPNNADPSNAGPSNAGHSNVHRANLDGVVDLTDTTDVDHATRYAPAVTHETVRPTEHEIVHEQIHRDIHTHDVYHRVQPIYDVELLPARHYVPNRSGDELHELSESELPDDCRHEGALWRRYAVTAPELDGVPGSPSTSTSSTTAHRSGNYATSAGDGRDGPSTMAKGKDTEHGDGSGRDPRMPRHVPVESFDEHYTEEYVYHPLTLEEPPPFGELVMPVYFDRFGHGHTRPVAAYEPEPAGSPPTA
ncbi:hypothetical protein GGR56DRAFT_695561 [Xylariaceae sp. FL0804]|nr:hypothetical protein GGR56DRAFT_695561 [Xylariaceae sp. FL0804]